MAALSAGVVPTHVPRAQNIDDVLDRFDEFESFDELESFDEFESFDEGFENAPIRSPRRPRSARREETRPASPTRGPRGDGPLELSGSVDLRASINYAQAAPNGPGPDFRGLSKLRATARLAAELKLPAGVRATVSGRAFRDLNYAIHDRDDYTHAVLDLYEAELELQEAFVEFSPLASLDLKLGRQSIVWGQSETLRVLDIWSPLDNREPGVVDLRDLRLPVVSSRVDYYAGPFKLSGVAFHESRFDENPPLGSEFFPLMAPIAPEDRPSNGGNDTEYGFELAGVFSGWDFSLHYARFVEEWPHLDPGVLHLRHRRLALVGASAGVSLGNWLLRSEVAHTRRLRFFNVAGDFERTDALVGIEYAGLRNATVSLELSYRRLHEFDPRLELLPDGQKQDRFEAALRFSRSFQNERLRMTFLAVVIGQQAEDGAAYRLAFDYDLRDALTIGGGVLLFEEGDLPPFNAIDQNDRVFFNLRYSF